MQRCVLPAVLAAADAASCSSAVAALFCGGPSLPAGAASAARFRLTGAANPASTSPAAPGPPLLGSNDAVAAADASRWALIPSGSVSAAPPDTAAVASATSGDSTWAAEVDAGSEDGPPDSPSASPTASGKLPSRDADLSADGSGGSSTLPIVNHSTTPGRRPYRSGCSLRPSMRFQAVVAWTMDLHHHS